MRSPLRHLAFALLLTMGLLAGCGDDPAPEPGPPAKEEIWRYSQEALTKLIQDGDPGGMAWIPGDVLERLREDDMASLGTVVAVLRKDCIGILGLSEDGTFRLDLRAKLPPDDWRSVLATGTWGEAKGGVLTLQVKDRQSKQIAPLEVPDVITARRTGEHLHLEALGRTIPFHQPKLPGPGTPPR